jgi:hypothetical protein
LGHSATLRFPSPLIKPDEPISGIRLSDWLHREVHGEQTNRSGFGTVSNSRSPLDGPIRAIEQPLAIMKYFLGNPVVGRPPLAIGSLLVRPEARLRHLRD